MMARVPSLQTASGSSSVTRIMSGPNPTPDSSEAQSNTSLIMGTLEPASGSPPESGTVPASVPASASSSNWTSGLFELGAPLSSPDAELHATSGAAQSTTTTRLSDARTSSARGGGVSCAPPFTCRLSYELFAVWRSLSHDMELRIHRREEGPVQPALTAEEAGG